MHYAVGSTGSLEAHYASEDDCPTCAWLKQLMEECNADLCP